MVFFLMAVDDDAIANCDIAMVTNKINDVHVENIFVKICFT